MTPDERATSQALAERIGASRFDLWVESAAMVTPSMRRLRLQADGLGGLGPAPGQDMMLSIATDEGSIVRRRYSIRTFDPAAERVDLDVVLHGDGPGARWAAKVQVGDAVEAIGPRGKVMVHQEARWHLFVGDESFQPAAFAMVESLAAETPAVVVLEVDGPEDEQPLLAPACPDGPIWVHRRSAPGGAMLAALASVELPAGPGHAYVGGEFHSVAALRSHLVARGLGQDQISPKAYWRAGASNASHGEPASDS